MPLSPQAFSAPSKQMHGSNPKGDLNSIASISTSSTISIPSSEPSASKPRDSKLKREQNPRYRRHNGLTSLRGQVEAALSAKVVEQRRSLESELSKLTRFQGGTG